MLPPSLDFKLELDWALMDFLHSMAIEHLPCTYGVTLLHGDIKCLNGGWCCYPLSYQGLVLNHVTKFILHCSLPDSTACRSWHPSFQLRLISTRKCCTLDSIYSFVTGLLKQGAAQAVRLPTKSACFGLEVETQRKTALGESPPKGELCNLFSREMRNGKENPQENSAETVMQQQEKGRSLHNVLEIWTQIWVPKADFA